MASFHMQVLGDCIRNKKQNISCEREELSDLEGIWHTLQSELCFANPAVTMLDTLCYFDNVRGEWLEVLLENNNKNMMNPIQRESEGGASFIKLKVTAEPNTYSRKESVIFEAVSHIALSELFNASPSSLALVEEAIQATRRHASSNPYESTVDLLKSPTFDKLQSTLGRELAKSAAKGAARVGTITPTITPTALAHHVAGSILPYTSRVPPNDSMSAAATIPQPASGSALKAVRNSPSPASLDIVDRNRSAASVQPPPARNKAVKQSTSDSYDAEDKFAGDASAPTRVPSTNYNNVAAGIAAAMRSSPASPQQYETSEKPPPPVKSTTYDPVTPAEQAPAVVPVPIEEPVVSTNGSRPSRNYESENTRTPREVSRPTPPAVVTPTAPTPTAARVRTSTANTPSAIGNSSIYKADAPSPYAPVSFTSSKDQITIYCVYSGATSQRAKAIKVPRKNPGYEFLMQTLLHKFNAELVLGYIDNTTGECSEVRDNDELAALIAHCDGDSLTLQCWAKETVRFDADIIDTEFERRMQAIDFGNDDNRNYADEEGVNPNAASNTPARNKSARPTSARSRGGDVSAAATPSVRFKTAPQQRTPSGGGYNINSNPLDRPANLQSNYAYPADYSTRSLTGHGANAPSSILSQATTRRLNGDTNIYAATGNSQVNSPQQQSRLTSSALASASGSTGPQRNKSANPSRPGSRAGGGAMSVASRRSNKPSITPGHKLDVSGTAWNEDQLRELFDQLDVTGDGLLDQNEMATYFALYHDDMGIYDAKGKFKELMQQTNYMSDGYLSFDEFAVVMLRIAQW